MASSCLNSIRVRLYFDYPPPATPDCRMCWLLVDLNKCRVVADLSSIIKEKLGYSRKATLDLFIEDCYLPSTESIYIVRDNDSVRVKVSSSISVNGIEDTNTDTLKPQSKKRAREDEKQIYEALKKKKKHEETQVNGLAPAENDKKKKKKKKKSKDSDTKPSTPQNTAATLSSTKTNKKGTSNNKINHANKQKALSSSSDSNEEETHKNTPVSKPKPTKKASAPPQKHQTSSESSSSDTEKLNSKPLLTPKPFTKNSKLQLKTPQQRKSSIDSSSSSSTSSSPTRKKSSSATEPSSTTQPALQPALSPVTKTPQENAESSESEIELVIKKPNLHGMGLKIASVSPVVGDSGGRERGNVRSQERSRGRGANRGSGRGGFGRARGTPWKQDFHFNYENNDRQKPNDSLTNESFIIQNPAEVTVPKRDYSTLPLLAAPPAIGQKIAFKLLELTESYTPEVSDYKEGKIIGFNSQTNVMELELLTRLQGPTEPGKFDLVYQNPDGSESVEYAVTHGSQLTERWDSLLEPRLIVENVG